MEVLSGVVGPVAEGVLDGLTQCGMRYSKVGTIWIRDESCACWDGVSVTGRGVLCVGKRVGSRV